jgi:uncharacterized membrane protein YtjA (UPF0391 family)
VCDIATIPPLAPNICPAGPSSPQAACTGNRKMLRLALFFFVISLIAAVFGFTGIAVATAEIARMLFFITIVIFVVLLVAGVITGAALF